MKKYWLALIVILGLASSSFAQEFSVGAGLGGGGSTGLGVGIHGDFAFFRVGNWGIGAHATGNVGFSSNGMGYLAGVAPIIYAPGEIFDPSWDKFVAYVGIGVGMAGSRGSSGIVGLEALFGVRIEVGNIDIFVEAVNISPFGGGGLNATALNVGLNFRFTTALAGDPSTPDQPTEPEPTAP